MSRLRNPEKARAVAQFIAEDGGRQPLCSPGRTDDEFVDDPQAARRFAVLAWMINTKPTESGAPRNRYGRVHRLD